MHPEQLSITAFRELFHEDPAYVVRAPGRVNIIGGHTDYNDGFVLPMAIDRAVWIALRPRDDRQVIVHSLERSEITQFSLQSISHKKGSWSEYVRGMAVKLQEAAYDLFGWEGVLSSDIPVGSGLSSSAALEMGVGCAFSLVSGFPFEGKIMAQLGQQTENEWVGANTGIMDQMISALGQPGHALLIDCRHLTTEAVPLPEELSILVMDTMTRHSHTDSGYNERRESCKQAAEVLKVSHLRDVSIDMLEEKKRMLDEKVYRRALHIVTENQRVLEAASAMRSGDSVTLGALVNASHTSLRDDFEITNDELNVMATLAQSQSGCYGARMIGGGFGGCVVAIVQSKYAESIAASVARQYESQTSIAPDMFVTKATNGVSTHQKWIDLERS